MKGSAEIVKDRHYHSMLDIMGMSWNKLRNFVRNKKKKVNKEIPVINWDDFIKSIEGKEYLTVPEVAAYLQLSENTVYSWCQKGFMPSVKIGGAVRIPKKDFLIWLEKHKRKTA